ncbi:hypothetical protein TBLA_0F02570 [Henningerozyma blattae CBS 6284]|uniref:Vacuolar fusion protein MON1 n=1 Tax=Henningerozyma blattae (strain ATCC 34711 / CBS 6284 / DSM 70876 / NBRC 10599 / NRRL Y-10934 / UCD 77-7) TaxID=1071380 RepID=I2H5Z4_HENB6|nr:hypothetical protein TBLA_0F02570 [Tetrapisispora blattae CBS 6284]CCH61796.1 hypothetical protein TBLA_0F02570 [Tetrapisispora blattae CBS 6284]
MEINEDYLDTPKQSNRKNLKSKSSDIQQTGSLKPTLILPDTLTQLNKPTTSVDLKPSISVNPSSTKNTTFQNNNNYAFNSDTSDRITIRSFNPSLYSIANSNVANTSFNDLEFALFNGNKPSNNANLNNNNDYLDNESINTILIERLNQSMTTSNNISNNYHNRVGFNSQVYLNSNQNSNTSSRIWKSPYVSNEIPNIFNNSSNISNTSISNESDLKNFEKNFFILSMTGKPIYWLYGNSKQITSYMAITNMIVSYFNINKNSNIKMIELPNKNIKFVFLNKSPIILMSVSKINEKKFEIINQLDFLYSYLLSIITERQLKKLFQKRSNFDLRNFLNYDEIDSLNKICKLVYSNFYPELIFGSIQTLRLKSHVRTKIHRLMIKYLIKKSDLPRGTLLYGILLGPQNKLISILRPHGHTLHTMDLQILFTLIENKFNKNSSVSSNTNNKDGEYWVPICFPKFNSNGYLYCYIKIQQDLIEKDVSNTLILISGQKDIFNEFQKLSNNFFQKLIEEKIFKIINNFKSYNISISEIPAPLIHHFIYKSRKHVQIIMPELYTNKERNNINMVSANSNTTANGADIELPNTERTHQQFIANDEMKYKIKLKNYYKELYNSIIDEDGNLLSTNLSNFIRWEAELPIYDENLEQSDYLEEIPNMLGLVWVTNTFELYLICNNGVMDKNTVFKSAKKIARWCKDYENELFVSEGAVF